MKIRKISIGLMFLILALVIVQGASAAHSSSMGYPSDNTGVAYCQDCHVKNSGPTCNACGHTASPTFSLSLVAVPASVTALSPTDVTLTVSKSNNVKSVLTPASGASVSLNGAGVSTSGTTDASGIVTKTVNPTGPGAINADATMTGFTSGTTSITVKAVVPVLTTITVTPSSANVLVGATQAFTAETIDQFANPIAATITWTSSNTAVGTVSATGVFTAVSAGATTITASSGSVKGTASVTVTAGAVVPVLTTITVTPSTANVLIGATQAFVAAPKDQVGNAIDATITWTSSDETVGTIDATNGTFIAIGAGKTTITATNGTVTGTAAVTVTATSTVPELTTITVTPSTANVLVGATQAFVAAPKDQVGNAIDAIITWTSSDETIGTIDATNGTFTAIAAGTTTITATSGTVTGTATVTVSTTTTPGDEEHEHDDEEHDGEEHHDEEHHDEEHHDEEHHDEHHDEHDE